MLTVSPRHLHRRAAGQDDVRQAPDGDEEEHLVEDEASRHGALLSSFLVIFVAEWGDLTQIPTANLAARYRSPLPVGLGATLAQ